VYEALLKSGCVKEITLCVPHPLLLGSHDEENEEMSQEMKDLIHKIISKWPSPDRPLQGQDLGAEEREHGFDAESDPTTRLRRGIRRLMRQAAIPGKKEVRRRSVEGCLANLAYAAQMNCGIILGFFKGGPLEDEAAAQENFIESLRAVCGQSGDAVPILVEATNRRETCVVRTLQDAETVLAAVKDPRLYLLPDTYHMNYEETDPMGEVKRLLPLIRNLHISDDNRYFPGLGSLDFGAVLRELKAMGYQGTLGIEGNTLETLEKDLETSVQAICRAAASL
jgi:sugar phosphate isomerase/epimerase